VQRSVVWLVLPSETMKRKKTEEDTNNGQKGRVA
jgi:hypothetical protein